MGSLTDRSHFAQPDITAAADARRMRKHVVAIAIAACAVLGMGAYAWASNQPADPSVSTQQQQPQQQHGTSPHEQQRHRPGLGRSGGLGALGGRAIHGDLRIQTRQGFQDVTFDRGTVTAVNASSITVHRADNQDVTEQIDANTRFRGVDSWQQVHTNEPATIVSRDGGHTAAVVIQRGNRVRNGNFPRPSGVQGSEEQVPAA